MSDTAIFDLDRTVTREPTWTRFLIFANRGRPVFWLHLIRTMAQGALYKLGFASRDSVKVVSLRALAHLSYEEAQAASAAFIAREMASGLRPGAVAAIRWHAARGDRLIIATASVDLVADELAKALGFNEVIATRLDWPGGPGRAAPRLASANCYGAEKMRRIGAHGIERSSYAYSDHVSDLPMLLNSDHGIAVNPSSGLRKAAQKLSLQIVDFNTASREFPSKEAKIPA